MRVVLPTVVFIITTAVQGAAITPRIDGCPPLAPWPMANPGMDRYHICCAYIIQWDQCCNRDWPGDWIEGGKPLRKCTSPDFQVN